MNYLEYLKSGNKIIYAKRGWYASEMNTWDDNKKRQILELYGEEGLTPNTYKWLSSRVEKSLQTKPTSLNQTSSINPTPVTTGGAYNPGGYLALVQPDNSISSLKLKMVSLAQNSKDPELLLFTSMSEGENIDENDARLIRRLQARYAIPVTGKLDDQTIEQINRKSSFFGKVGDFIQNATKKGSPIRQVIRAGIDHINPFSSTSELRNNDFTDGQKRVLNNILNSALSLKKDNIYTVSGTSYSDGYASTDAGFSDNKLDSGLDILFKGNDQKGASYSIGGATVRTYTLPNGKRIALLTDTFDFDNDRDRNYDSNKSRWSSGNITTTLGNMMHQPSSRTMYGIYDDGTDASQEDMDLAYQYWKDEVGRRKEVNPNYKVLNLAKIKNTGLSDLMYTKWTGKGNVYKDKLGSKINYLNFCSK